MQQRILGAWKRPLSGLVTSGLVAALWPYGNHPLSATFLLSVGIAVLTLSGVLFSLVLVATQFVGRHGVITPKAIMSVRIRWSITSMLVTALVLLALAHMAEDEITPFRYTVAVRYYWYSLISIQITNRFGDIVGVFLLSHSIFSILPVAREIQRSMQSKQVLLNMTQAIIRARNEKQITEEFTNYKEFLLAHARQDEVLHFIFGLKSINAALIENISAGGLSPRLRKVHSMETQRLYDDAMLIRATDASIVRQLHYHHVELLQPLTAAPDLFQAHLTSIMNRTDMLLRRYQSGEIDNTTGIQVLKAMVRVDEVCLDTGAYLSLSNVTIQMNRCLLSFIHNRNHRGIIAVYATVVGLLSGRCIRDVRLLNGVLANQFIEMVTLLSNNSDRPVLPHFRIARMLPIVIQIHNMREVPARQKDRLSRSMLTLKTEEVASLLGAYKVQLNQLGNLTMPGKAKVDEFEMYSD